MLLLARNSLLQSPMLEDLESLEVLVTHQRSCARTYVLALGALSIPELTGHAQIKELKEGLKDKNAPFGVDLLLPQVGGSARKTNVRTPTFDHWDCYPNCAAV